MRTNENHYIENQENTEVSSNETLFELDSIEQVPSIKEPTISLEDEQTPKLFSEETILNQNNISSPELEQKLFDKENTQEEDFEIPAFLRRQKF